MFHDFEFGGVIVLWGGQHLVACKFM